MKVNWGARPLLIAIAGWCSGASAVDAPVPAPTSTSVQFTVRICEGKDDLNFWFNDEAKAHWNTCKLPLSEIPVILVAESGKRIEGKTGTDGIANLPELVLAPSEKFRMAMACTTHRCFSLHGLWVGAPDIKSGTNTLYAETVARTEPAQK